MRHVHIQHAIEHDAQGWLIIHKGSACIAHMFLEGIDMLNARTTTQLEGVRMPRQADATQGAGHRCIPLAMQNMCATVCHCIQPLKLARHLVRT